MPFFPNSSLSSKYNIYSCGYNFCLPCIQTKILIFQDSLKLITNKCCQERFGTEKILDNAMLIQ